jgi:MFS family permease
MKGGLAILISVALFVNSIGPSLATAAEISRVPNVAISLSLTIPTPGISTPELSVLNPLEPIVQNASPVEGNTLPLLREDAPQAQENLSHPPASSPQTPEIINANPPSSTFAAKNPMPNAVSDNAPAPFQSTSANLRPQATPKKQQGGVSGFFKRIKRGVVDETVPWDKPEAQAITPKLNRDISLDGRNARLDPPSNSKNLAEKIVAVQPPLPSGEKGPKQLTKTLRNTLAALTARLSPMAFSRKIWAGLARAFHVFPDPLRNREFWKYTWAGLFISQGYTFYSTALPTLVAPVKSLAGRMGPVRASSFGAQLAINVVMGPVVDRSKISSLLFKTYMGRGLILILAPALFFIFFHGHGAFPYLPLLGLIIGASFFQSAGMLASNVAYTRILGDNLRYYNKANAVNSLIGTLGGIVSPILAGAFIAWANLHIGAFSGNVLSFGVYGLLVIATALVFRSLTLVNNNQQNIQIQNPADAAKSGTSRSLRLRKTFSNAAPAAKEKGRQLIEVGNGLRLLWRNRFLKWTLLFSTVFLLLGDSTLFVVLPLYISGILKSAPIPAFLTHWPWLCRQLTGLIRQPAAIFGLFLAASNLGATPFSLILMFRHGRSSSDAVENVGTAKAETTSALTSTLRGAVNKLISVLKSAIKRLPLSRLHLGNIGKNLSPLERQGIWSSILNGVGWIATLSLFLTSHLWLALGAYAFSALLQSPSSIIWGSLQQGVFIKDYPKDQAKLWAAISLYNQVFALLGDLVLGWLVTQFPIKIAVSVAMVGMGIVAIAAFVQPVVVFRKHATTPPGDHAADGRINFRRML